ncbi:MAG: ATP-dependent DNA helicase [Longicatena sp.]
MYTCKLSVRALVESVYQSGDLIASSTSYERANLGSLIHRELQATAQGDYESEVFLKIDEVFDDINFHIEGRCDGLLKENDIYTIDEIKTTAIPYEDIQDNHYVHFAQAYCYGYMLMVERNMKEVNIQLTYYQIEQHKTKVFIQHKTREELEMFFYDTLLLYVRWAKLSINIKQTTSSSLKELVFPFREYREGQRTLAIAVYKTILDKDIVFVQAPTGIGKTISTIFPALKAIGEGKAEKIFYLCAKNITASVAYDTLQTLYEQDVHFKSVGIIAKDKICFLEKRNCDPKKCPYAKGYYDRSRDALYELLSTTDFMRQEQMEEIAKKYQVCPFELSLDASLFADIIICDYNYVFDPKVYLKRFFSEQGDYVFLVDEAHNLVDRGRDNYSASLSKATFMKLKQYLPKDSTLLLKSIRTLNTQFLAYKKLCMEQNTTFYSQSEAMLSIKPKLSSFIEHMDAYLQSEHDERYDDEIREVYFQAVNYTKIMDYYDENFVTTLSLEDKDISVKQYCMNPAHPIRDILKKGTATVFFSATLSPISYFLDLLGGTCDSKRLSLPSPFPKEHVKIIIQNNISTRYINRAASIAPIVRSIHIASSEKLGNYLVFCPSYAYMQQISNAYAQAYQTTKVSIQRPDMDALEKQAFLTNFETTNELHLYFAVLGGMFGEGIDLKGDKLIGAFLIGVGLPQINPQQDLIKDHFDQENQNGFAYAYRFPGMNKVLQGAGRVIRSHRDLGILVFIDERYTTRAYMDLLPLHLRHYEVIQDEQTLQSTLRCFWKENTI